MERDTNHLREQADRARWWAACIPDPYDRRRIEAVARDYEEMARRAERETADQDR
jgi:hypothetical protein